MPIEASRPTKLVRKAQPDAGKAVTAASLGSVATLLVLTALSTFVLANVVGRSTLVMAGVFSVFAATVIALAVGIALGYRLGSTPHGDVNVENLQKDAQALVEYLDQAILALPKDEYANKGNSDCRCRADLDFARRQCSYLARMGEPSPRIAPNSFREAPAEP